MASTEPETKSFTFANGDVYVGQWEEDMPHGQGEYVSIKDGRRHIWSGTFENGDPVQGSHTVDEEYKYVGHFLNFMQHDPDGSCVYVNHDSKTEIKFQGLFQNGVIIKGTLSLPDGRVFEGECKNKVMDGQGTLTFNAKDIKKTFIGTFVKNMYVQGVLTYKETVTELDEYTGPLKDGQWHGDGILRWKQGNKFKYDYYEGSFIRGEVRRGRLCYLDGSHYHGAFLKNQSHGQGTRVFTSEHKYYVTFTGIFHSGTMQHGVLQTVKGHSFSGEFKNGKASDGELKFQNGDIYVGAVGGKSVFMHGTGKMMFKETPNDDMQLEYTPTTRGPLAEFKGEFSNNVPQTGRLTYTNRAFYTGPVNADYLPHGKGTHKFNVVLSDSKAAIPEMTKVLFKGRFEAGQAKEGTLTYKEGNSVYVGHVSPDWKPHGTGKLTDNVHQVVFEGTLKLGLPAQGVLHLNAVGDVYTGTFNSTGQFEDANGQLVMKSKRAFQGEFVAGNPVTGTVTYHGAGELASSEDVYVGKVNDGIQREGQGVLTFTSPHPRKYLKFEGQFVADHMEGEGKLLCSDDRTFVGTMHNSKMQRGVLEFRDTHGSAVYQGGFDDNELKEGSGERTFGDKRTFAGEFKRDMHYKGVMTYPNGVKYDSTFFAFESKEALHLPQGVNTDLDYIPIYGAGTGIVHFPDGQQYAHVVEDEKSFFNTLRVAVQSTSTLVTETDDKTITSLTELGVWPILSDVEAIQLPKLTKKVLFAVQSQGGAAALELAANERRDLIENLKAMHQIATEMLASEIKIDGVMRARFPGWSLEPSSALNVFFYEKIAELNAFIAQEVKANEISLADWKDREALMEPLKTSAEQYESGLYQEESNSPLRADLRSLILQCHGGIEARKKHLQAYTALTSNLDVIQRFLTEEGMNGDQLQAVLDEELASVDPIVEAIQKTTVQGAEFVSELREKFKLQSAVRQELIDVKLAQINKETLLSVSTFNSLFGYFTDANDVSSTFLNEVITPLKLAIHKFFMQRQSSKRELGAKLLLAELHAAIIEDNVMEFDKVLLTRLEEIQLDLDATNEQDLTALGLAIIHGRPHFIGKLCAAGVSLTKLDAKRHNYTFIAAMEAKRNVKELLIALGKGGMNYNAIADHNAQLTALQLMAIQNRADMVHLLIQLGARLREEATSGDGKTALHCACASTPPSIETIILLIQSGSAVNARDAEMNTPLHLSSSEQVADILIAAGANIQAKNSSKQKALFHVLAASQGLPKELQTQYNKAEKTADKREAVQLDGEPLDSTHELWMEDEKHEKCVTCVKAFGTFTRRHHCRRCGLVLCDKCSPKRGYETTSPKTKLRLCDGCFNSLNDPVNHELYEVPSTTQISAVSTTTVVISEPELVPQQRNSISQLRPLEEDSLLEPESPRSVRFASLKVDNRQSENMFAGNRARASALFKPGDLERLEEAGGDEFKREDSGLRTISITSSNITAVQQSKATPIAGGQMENDLDDLFATPPQ